MFLPKRIFSISALLVMDHLCLHRNYFAFFFFWSNGPHLSASKLFGAWIMAKWLASSTLRYLHVVIYATQLSLQTSQESNNLISFQTEGTPREETDFAWSSWKEDGRPMPSAAESLFFCSTEMFIRSRQVRIRFGVPKKEDSHMERWRIGIVESIVFLALSHRM